MIFGTLRISELIDGQNALIWGILPRWGVVVQPLGFLLFFGAVLAGLERAPVGIADGAPGAIADSHAEYGGLRFAAFVIAGYARLAVAAALIASLFFGGYQIPWLPRSALEARAGLYLTVALLAGGILSVRVAIHFFRRANRERRWRHGSSHREPRVLGSCALIVGLGLWSCLLFEPWLIEPSGASLVATVAMSALFAVKTAFCAWLLIWVRWTVVSLRYDQVIHLAWRVMLPLGLINLAATAGVLALTSR
jgi:NADH-quinone oxidoreductase subunit H